MGGTNGLKEREKVLVVGMSRVVREKPVSGSIRQLSVSLISVRNLSVNQMISFVTFECDCR